MLPLLSRVVLHLLLRYVDAAFVLSYLGWFFFSFKGSNHSAEEQQPKYNKPIMKKCSTVPKIDDFWHC